MEEIIEYYDNGAIKQRGYLKDGKKEGEWITYFKNGDKYIREVHKDDKLDGMFMRWNEEGFVMIESEYVNGISHGIWKEYYDDGFPKEEGAYINGEYDVKNWWDEDGKQTLINGTGVKIEKYRYYELDVYKQYFENGIMIKEEKISSRIIIPNEDGSIFTPNEEEDGE